MNIAPFANIDLSADGSVGAPAISFAADPDSGFYRIGANNFGAAVNGAKVLDIGVDGLGVTGGLTLTGPLSGQSYGDLIYKSSNSRINNAFGGNGGLGLYGAGNIGLLVDGTEALRVIAGGNVGIGTASPITRLHVAQALDTISGGFSIVNSGSSGSGRIWVDGNGVFKLDAGSGGGNPVSIANGTIYVVSGSGIGIGVTPRAWNSVFRGVDIGAYGTSLSGRTDVIETSLTANAYRSAASGWVYTTTGIAQRYTQSGGAHYWYSAASGAAGAAIPFTQAMTLHASGGLSLGNTTDPGASNLSITGNISAATKSFLIDHPTKPNHKLRYGSLEGPENGVYVRGYCKGNCVNLPDYWEKLVDPASITVTLTPIGRHQNLYVVSTANNKIEIADVLNQPVECFYTVFAERVDVDKLVVQVEL